MNSYINRSRILVLPLILSTLVSGCTTTTNPQNTNTPQPSNKNASTSPAPVETRPGTQSAPVGFLDGVQGETKTGASITVSGWAADAEDGAPVTKVEVLLDNNVVAQATLGKNRPDVATTTGRPDWKLAGWEAAVSLANVAPGRHKITAIAYDSAGTKQALNGARDIAVATK